MMNPLILWPVFVMVMLAAAIDIRTRRIPNWLTLPCLAGGVAVNVGLYGWSGLGQSIAGMALAVLIVGGLCWLRTMGFGDLKLCAAAGAWIGPSSLLFALAIAAMAGGILALAYAGWKGKLGLALDRAANLSRQTPPGRTMDIFHPEALTIPYAPAIAAGVLFSFFAN
jgi:prepilin peptidase CpaA